MSDFNDLFDESEIVDTHLSQSEYIITIKIDPLTEAPERKSEYNIIIKKPFKFNIKTGPNELPEINPKKIGTILDFSIEKHSLSLLLDWDDYSLNPAENYYQEILFLNCKRVFIFNTKEKKYIY